jgi:hypothetical protein
VRNPHSKPSPFLVILCCRPCRLAAHAFLFSCHSAIRSPFPPPHVAHQFAVPVAYTANCATSRLLGPPRRPLHPHVCTVNDVAPSLCRSPKLCASWVRRDCSGRLRCQVGALGLAVVERTVLPTSAPSWSGLCVGIGVRPARCFNSGIFGAASTSMLLCPVVVLFHGRAAKGAWTPAPVVAAEALFKIFPSTLFSAGFNSVFCSCRVYCHSEVLDCTMNKWMLQLHLLPCVPLIPMTLCSGLALSRRCH